MRNDRRHQSTRSDDYRSPSQRDCDRLLYSSAFRRLAGVTQVVAADETHLFHNRLTHTMKVAQVARRVTQSLIHSDPDLKDVLDPDVATAAAFAHDIGHPPFGHIAERVLNKQCIDRGLDGFEGNAQSFRIVTKCSVRSHGSGLNLTRATLRAILKYPWMESDRGKRAKWGAFASERNDFEFATTEGGHEAASLENQIMDLADDISYAVHDLEDFYRAGLVPLHLLRHPGREREDFMGLVGRELGARPQYDPGRALSALTAVLELTAIEDRFRGTAEDRQLLNMAGSNLITRFIGQCSVSNGSDLFIPPEVWHEINVLKQITWQFVINSPNLGVLQQGQTRTVGFLFETLYDWLELEHEKGTLSRLPARLAGYYRAISDDAEAAAAYGGDHSKLMARAVCDYIASMTERQAIQICAQLDGRLAGSILDATHTA